MYFAQLEPISNRADWFGTVELVNDDTNEIITDLTGVTAKIYVSSKNPCYRVLSGTTEDGHILLVDGGIISWQFTATEMAPVCAGTYDIGITIARDNITQQELIGSLPIVDGVMR